MLIKLIVCRVPSQHRERFARGQRRWSILSGAPGFLGQLGGWNRDDPSQAVIVGLWRSDGAYANFMADMHDPIFEGGEQPGSYDAISVTLWDQLCDMPGMTAAIPTAIRVSGLIRLARCELLPNRRDHFVRAQHTIWNPGMGACDGILAGAFTQSRDRDGPVHRAAAAVRGRERLCIADRIRGRHGPGLVRLGDPGDVAVRPENGR